VGAAKKLSQKAKSPPIAAIPKHVMDSDDYIKLSGNAVKLLMEAARQYNMRNNGKLCLPWSQLKERGWRSQSTLNNAKKELLANSLLYVSKYGGFKHGKGTVTYYALSWHKVDEINGFIMDINSTNKPLRSNWRK